MAGGSQSGGELRLVARFAFWGTRARIPPAEAAGPPPDSGAYSAANWKPAVERDSASSSASMSSWMPSNRGVDM
jgi:hypothetical protein